MDVIDRTCTTMPYFEIPSRNMEQFRMFCRRNDIGFIREEAERSLAESRLAVASNR